MWHTIRSWIFSFSAQCFCVLLIPLLIVFLPPRFHALFFFILLLEISAAILLSSSTPPLTYLLCREACVRWTREWLVVHRFARVSTFLSHQIRALPLG